MKDITYRKMRDKDINIFVQMRVHQLREEGAKQEIDLEPYLQNYYKKHLADGTFVSWLAIADDRIIATSGMSFVEKPPYYSNPSGKMGLISSMYTVSEFRRRGIARILLDKIMEEAKRYECGVVQITASDMGILLYSDYGFRKHENFMQYIFHG